MKRYTAVDTTDSKNDFSHDIKVQDDAKFKRPTHQLDFYDKMEKFGEYLWIKVQAIAWVSGAIAIIYYSNFFKQLFHNENINQLFLTLAMLFIGVNIALSVYAAVIVPYILKIKEELEVYNPKAIQIGAFSGFMTFLTLTIAVWPVWGLLSFPMIFVMFLGLLNTGHFLPNHQMSGFLFGAIFIGAFFSHLLIEHEGYWH